MLISQVIEILKNEMECVRRANSCDRQCQNCDLVRDDTEILDAYNAAIYALELLEAE